jgi:hypothetical protein
LLQTLDEIRQPYDSDQILEWLALLAVFLRHARLAVDLDSTNSGVQILMPKVITAFQPQGDWSGTILLALASSDKYRRAKASDAVLSAARLSSSLPKPNFLVPWLLDTIDNNVSSRHHLTLISILVNFVPTKSIPPNLVGDLLADSWSDFGHLRGETIAMLLYHRYVGTMLKDEIPKCQFMLEPLRSHMDNSNIARYVLPAHLKGFPNSFSVLLELANSTFAWMAVASLGVQLGLLDMRKFPEEKMRAALSHSEVEVRFKAFQLATETLQFHYIREAFRWNAVLPSAG